MKKYLDTLRNDMFKGMEDVYEKFPNGSSEIYKIMFTAFLDKLNGKESELVFRNGKPDEIKNITAAVELAKITGEKLRIYVEGNGKPEDIPKIQEFVGEIANMSGGEIEWGNVEPVKHRDDYEMLN